MGDTKNGRERKGLVKQSQREVAVIERDLELREADDEEPDA